jgi:hypothetical protein
MEALGVGGCYKGGSGGGREHFRVVSGGFVGSYRVGSGGVEGISEVGEVVA